MAKSSNLKIKHITATDQVCDSMKQLILNHTWESGQKIPSEIELSEIYGVNRLTIRMALQKLNTFGVIETQIGNGTFVKDFDFNNHMKELSDFYINPQLLDDVCEFRKHIEIECARLAIERATEEELEELRIACENYEKFQDQHFASDSDPDDLANNEDELFNQYAALDLEFHHQICRMSHNHLFEYSFAMAKETILKYMVIINKQRYVSWRKYQTHPRDLHTIIYEGIKNKDFKTVEEVYRQMVDYTVELYLDADTIKESVIS